MSEPKAAESKDLLTLRRVSGYDWGAEKSAVPARIWSIEMCSPVGLKVGLFNRKRGDLATMGAPSDMASFSENMQRYKTHLNRKLESTLAMELKLQKRIPLEWGPAR
jgi:hypothetical protein